MQKVTPEQIASLAPDRDLFGGVLLPGIRVRSFSFPDLHDGTLYGFDHEGPRASYGDGILEAVAEEIIEGCHRYTILIEQEMAGGRPVTSRLGHRCYPPVNGTPRLLGGVTCGVLRCDPA